MSFWPIHLQVGFMTEEQLMVMEDSDVIRSSQATLWGTFSTSSMAADS